MEKTSAAPVDIETERSGIDADHQHMCQFSTQTDMGYRTIAEALIRYSLDAPSLIAQRSAKEKEMVSRQRAEEALELTQAS